ncbi:putative histidine kinase, partial [Salmonella enterica subsp. enterica serovar Heidelberg str. CFSAN002071]
MEALLRDVRQHPQQRRLWLDVKSWLIQHQLMVGGVILAFLLLTLNYIWVMLMKNYAITFQLLSTSTHQ